MKKFRAFVKVNAVLVEMKKAFMLMLAKRYNHLRWSGVPKHNRQHHRMRQIDTEKAKRFRRVLEFVGIW
jgi:hypothetical protein